MNSITLLGNFIAEEMSEEKKLSEKIYSQIESSGLDPTDVLDELVSINSKMQSNKEDYQSYIGDNDE
tara:strand:+ start:81 stop:281 length:201 start_codon:yes stop_codon:yes gene_type:complete